MQDKEKRIRNVKIFMGVMLAAGLLGMFAATQAVASDCEYADALGGFLPAGDFRIYPPYRFFLWDYRFGEAMPAIIESASRWLYLSLMAGFFLAVTIIKRMEPLTTHGAARWATARDIELAELTNNPGVIVGVNPYNGKLMRDDGPAHVFLMSPTRGGKGVGIIIPTCLTWPHSIFVTDVKGENWEYSAGYRKNVMHQKCIKFAPLENDGSSARWNPLAEIRMKTIYESGDLETVAGILINPKGENKDSDYWPQAGKILLKGAILHHLYQFERENRPLPNLTNVFTFLSNITDALETMATYPHITQQEFLKDKNIFQKCYVDDYITNFEPYEKAIEELFHAPCRIRSVNELKAEIKKRPVKRKVDARKEDLILKAQEKAEKLEAKAQAAEEAAQKAAQDEQDARDMQAQAERDAESAESEEERDEIAGQIVALIKEVENCSAKAEQLSRKSEQLAKEAEYARKEYDEVSEQFEDDAPKIDFEAEPWCYLLVHPKVRECATSMLDKAKDELSGVQSTAATCLNLYSDPIVQVNTSTSDFRLQDLLDPDREVSFFLVIPPNDLAKLTPLVRLLVDLMFNRLIRDMKNEHIEGIKRQRLLLMLDEFAQFGRFDTVETAMAVCASYGIKMCIVSQNIKQVNKAYTKDQSILGNCHTQIYHTPNPDGAETAKYISEQLGNETIIVENKSDGGGGLFKGSISRSGIARKLMTQEEVAGMPFERELVVTARNPPIYARKLIYYKDKRFKRRVLPPPLYSDTCERIDSFAKLHAILRPEMESRAEAAAKIAKARKAAGDDWKEAAPQEEHDASSEILHDAADGTEIDKTAEDRKAG